MNIKCVQFSPQFGKLNENLTFISSICEQINSEILIFPELSTSGYFYTDRSELLKNSISLNSVFFENIQIISNKLRKIIIIGYAEKFVNNNSVELYNSAVIISPNQEIFNYRKIHLFYKEHFVFNEGNLGFNVFHSEEFDINLGLMICYDWRFPEAARTLALKGADLIACPSNLVTNLWFDVMKSRAIENKVYFAVANRIGSEINNDEKLEFLGSSAIFSYDNKILAKANSNSKEDLSLTNSLFNYDYEIIDADIDFKSTRNKNFNSINNIFEDRRPEFYL